MADRDALALDVAAAHRRRVEQQVDQVVVQQVDLVDVEHAPVGGGEQARLEGAYPLAERLLQVQRADHPVLGGADRQLDQPGRTGLGGGAGRMRAVRAARVGLGRVTTEAAAGHPATGGSSAARARTAVDLAVPFSPRTSTPPIAGETALSSSASRMSAMPSTALNG